MNHSETLAFQWSTSPLTASSYSLFSPISLTPPVTPSGPSLTPTVTPAGPSLDPTVTPQALVSPSPLFKLNGYQ